ncbi:hypothetical protein [Desmospora activa]|uniref:Uncharacterized protein n=1 Tax=Desmospora activa DSM 45169 TaxID=1121389 RepID=A0A2T4Z979_9BACL|nr:hypothetical protein [Desmospora activa]PTM58452.1 hypothetical protein C8J48_1035 [Desmospora activa DSM 45169]
MRKLDIQVDISEEYQMADKSQFHHELRSLLEKYFALNSIHIRKEVHTVEVAQVNIWQEETIKPAVSEPAISEPTVSESAISEIIETIEMEREPLVQVFDSTENETQLPKLQPKKTPEPDYY